MLFLSGKLHSVNYVKRNLYNISTRENFIWDLSALIFEIIIWSGITWFLYSQYFTNYLITIFMTLNYDYFLTMNKIDDCHFQKSNLYCTFKSLRVPKENFWWLENSGPGCNIRKRDVPTDWRPWHSPFSDKLIRYAIII